MRRIPPAVLALSLLVLVLAGATSARPAWLPPFDLSSATEDVGTAKIGLDRAGDAVAVWWSKSGDYAIEARERKAGRRWSVAHPLAAGADRAGDVDLAVDSAGNALAAWAVLRGSIWIVEVSERPAGHGWSPARRLWLADESPYMYGASVTGVRVAINDRGAAAVLWEFTAVPDDGSVQRDLNVATRAPNGDWFSYSELSFHPFGESADVGLDAAGKVTALWAEQAAEATPIVIRSATWPAGKPWTRTERVSFGLDPQLVVDAAGSAVAVWWSPRGLMVSRRRAGGSWSRHAHVLARSTQTDEFRPALAGDAAGDVVVVWEQSERQGRRFIPWLEAATRSRRRGVWSKPTKIGRGYFPDVAMDPSGGAVAVWRKNLNMWAARRPAHGPWSRVSQIWPAGIFEQPEVAVDGHGNAVADWMYEDMTGRWTEAAVLDASGPVFRKLAIPARARAGPRTSFSVAPFDVWSHLGAPPRWSFGDGESAVGTKVSHTYRAPGSYRIRVTQLDAHGNRTSVTRTLSVEP